MQLIYTIAGVDNGTVFNIIKVFVDKYTNEIHVPKSKTKGRWWKEFRCTLQYVYVEIYSNEICVCVYVYFWVYVGT